MKDIEKQIREEWFPSHRATLTQHGDLQVLMWKQEGTNTYMCRYVFDGNKMYISGDIGTAVFWLTWKADIHSFNDIHVGYFEEKLDAFSGDRRNFNSKKAVKGLRDWVRNLKDNDKEYDHGNMQELFEAARNCSSSSEWAHIVNGDLHDFIYQLDYDYWDWIYAIGDEIPARVHGYLIGLKMASEQLRKEVLNEQLQGS